MSNISENILKIKKELPESVTLLAVSKTHPAETILEAYKAGQRDFGENKVQELLAKQSQLSSDIRWHLIGHLQSNKVKYIAPFVSLIHSVDSLGLLEEINKQALKNNRVIDCLLQIYIAREETKFGLSIEEAEQILASDKFKTLKNVRITGLMGMASNTDDQTRIRSEFKALYDFFTRLSNRTSESPAPGNLKPEILSMGMSADYKIAIEEGSTLVRAGSIIFGTRKQ